MPRLVEILKPAISIAAQRLRIASSQETVIKSIS